MAVVNQGRYPSDVLKDEATNDYSRETVTIETGNGVLDIGTVIGIKTSNGKWSVATASGATGLEQCRGVLLEMIDATSADKKAVIIRRGKGKVNSNALIFGATFTTQALRDAGAAQLEANSGIIARRGA